MGQNPYQYQGGRGSNDPYRNQNTATSEPVAKAVGGQAVGEGGAATAQPQPGPTAPSVNYAQAPGGQVNLNYSHTVGLNEDNLYYQDPSAYILGRSETFAPELAAAIHSTAVHGARRQNQIADQQQGYAQLAYLTGANTGREIAGYAPGAYQYGRGQADALTGQGNAFMGEGEKATGRAGPAMDYGQAQGALRGSMGAAGALQGLEREQGPSGAQALLQQGTDQAMANQLALARSGRGFGGDATAMGQAQQANAATAMNAANQGAQLRAQEDAAWRQRQAQNIGAAAGIQQAAAQQYAGQTNAAAQVALQQQAQNDAARQGLYGLGAESLLNAGQLGMGAYTTGAGLLAQGAGTQYQGYQTAGQLQQAAAQAAGLGTSQLQQGYQTVGQLAQTQAQMAQARDQLAQNYYAIQQGQAAQQQAQNMQLLGAGIQTAGTIGGAVIGGAFGGPGGAALGGSLGSAGTQAGWAAYEQSRNAGR